MSPAGGRSAADVALAAKVAAGALAGGLFAVLVVWILFGVHRPWFLGATVLVVTAVCVLAVDLLRLRGGRVRIPRPVLQPSTWGPPAPPGPLLPPAPAHAPAPDEPAWYQEAGRTAAQLQTPAGNGGKGQAPQVRSPLEPEVDGPPGRVDEYAVPGRSGGVRRVVQCPRCADFAITVGTEPGGYAFVCDRCRHRWEWGPGRPWPGTVVSPALGRTRPPTSTA